MADKEERILIDVINPGINCVYRLDNDPKGQSLCKHNGNMEPVTAKDCRNCEEGMTRQEAIESMAKAICKQTNYQCSVCEVGNDKEKCEEWIVFQYKTQAEAALNSLLEDKK